MVHHSPPLRGQSLQPPEDGALLLGNNAASSSHSSSLAQCHTKRFVSVSTFLEGHSEWWMLLCRSWGGFWLVPPPPFFFFSMNCITWRPLGFIHLTPVVTNLSRLLWACFLHNPSVAKAGYSWLTGLGKLDDFQLLSTAELLTSLPAEVWNILWFWLAFSPDAHQLKHMHHHVVPKVVSAQLIVTEALFRCHV